MKKIVLFAVTMTLSVLMISCFGSGSNFTPLKDITEDVNTNKETQNELSSQNETNTNNEENKKMSPEEIQKSVEDFINNPSFDEIYKDDKYSYDPIKRVAKNEYVELSLPYGWIPGKNRQECNNTTLYAELDTTLEVGDSSVEIRIEPNSQISLSDYIKDDVNEDYKKASTSAIGGIEMEIYSSYSNKNYKFVTFYIYGKHNNNIYRIIAYNNSNSEGPNMDSDLNYIMDYIEIK